MLTVKYCYEHKYRFAPGFDSRYIDVFKPCLEEDGLYVYSHRYLLSTVRRFCTFHRVNFCDLVY